VTFDCAFDCFQIEDASLREQIERYNQRIREFEEKNRIYCGQQPDRIDSDLLDVSHCHCKFILSLVTFHILISVKLQF